MGEDRSDPCAPPPAPFAPMPHSSDISASPSRHHSLHHHRYRTPSPPRPAGRRMGGEWDWREVGDETIAQLCVFNCPDKPTGQLQDENRAMTSLPLNLTIRPSNELAKALGVFSTDFIPRGARFGPIVGSAIRMGGAEAASAEGRSLASRPPSATLWKVFAPSGGSHVTKMIDSSDDSRSNWMKYVKRATTDDGQNLVACQIDQDIYFYSIKSIAPNTELLFWYSRDYAIRLGVPASCESLRASSIALHESPSSLPPWPPSAAPTACAPAPSATCDSEEDSRHCQRTTASPQEALDFSIKKETEIVKVELTAEEARLRRKREEEEEPHHLEELTPMTSHSASPRHSSLTSSTLTSAGVSPNLSELRMSSSISTVPTNRPNVIQNPIPNVHRPVPQRLPSLSLGASSSPVRPSPILPFTTIFEDYFRRTGGLWVQPNGPSAASVAHASTQPAATGRPADAQPVFGATASPPFGYSNLYTSTTLPGPPAATSVAAPGSAFSCTTTAAGGCLSGAAAGSGAFTPSGASAAAAFLHSPVPSGGDWKKPLPVVSRTATPVPLDSYSTQKYEHSQENGKARYKCKQCEKSFGQLSNLKVHLRTHTGERPFKCNSCGRDFTQLAHLQKHNLVHTGERPHRCDICDKRFSSTSNLKTHLRLHNGQKPYSCDVCAAKFTQFVHLKLHKRLHANERPFACSQCNKKYISPSGLRTHWKSTTCKAEPMLLGDEDSHVSSTTPVLHDDITV